MSSSRPATRVLRRGAVPSVSAAQFTVDLAASAHHADRTVAERIELAAAEAYRRGLDEGRAAAAAELAAAAEAARRSRLQALAEVVGRTLAAIAEERRTAVAVAEVEVAELAVELATAIVGHELALGGPAVADAVRRALSLVPDGADLVIRLHPDDLDDAGDLPELVAETAGVVGQVQVVADPRVEAGGCVVEAGSCHVDAQIGPALERARQVLADLRPEGPVGGDHEPVPAGGSDTASAAAELSGDRRATRGDDDGGQP